MLTAPDLAAQVRAARTAVDRDAGEARAVGRAGQAATARVAQLKEQIALHERVIAALTKVGEERQAHAQQQVEGLVTQGLAAVFGEGMTFHVNQAVSGNQATVEFVIRSEHIAGDEAGANCDAPMFVETPVIGARGGGVAAVTGFLLRLVVLLLTPSARRILFLDETFAHVSAEYREPLGQFLREVCDRAGTQIVMITHDPEYAALADTSYRLALGSDGATQVSQG
jgi:DNA repair exonuclease SbcCD ATPase subunit